MRFLVFTSWFLTRTERESSLIRAHQSKKSRNTGFKRSYLRNFAVSKDFSTDSRGAGTSQNPRKTKPAIMPISAIKTRLINKLRSIRPHSFQSCTRIKCVSLYPGFVLGAPQAPDKGVRFAVCFAGFSYCIILNVPSSIFISVRGGVGIKCALEFLYILWDSGVITRFRDPE